MDSARISSVLARVDAELAAGRPWRAREILQGWMRHEPPPELTERYGLLLDDLGDRVEAGKYLFLSGRRGPGSREPIRLFLDRHGRGYLDDLLAQFSRSIRNGGVEALPTSVRAEIEALGLVSRGRRSTTRSGVPHPRLRTRIVDAIGWIVVAASVVAIPVGLITMARWVIRLLWSG
jgi:hypothetical protein